MKTFQKLKCTIYRDQHTPCSKAWFTSYYMAKNQTLNVVNFSPLSVAQIKNLGIWEDISSQQLIFCLSQRKKN